MYLKNLSANFPHLDRLLAVFVFFTSLTAYLTTLAPTIYIEDAAEFATAVPTLGIAHPSGFPMYMILGKLFTMLAPFGEMAFRVNLFSALVTSIMLVIFFFVLRRLDLSPLIAAASSFLLGFSQMIWHEATYAEVYALNTLFAVSFLWCFVGWKRERRLRYFFLLVGLAGFSLANHLSILVYFPGVLFFFILYWDKKLFDFKVVLTSLVLFLAPLSLYFYFPIRSAADPAFYFRLLNAGSPAGVAEGVEQFAESSLRHSITITENTATYLGYVAADLVDELPFLAIVFLVVGLFSLFFRDKRFWLVVVGFLFLGSIGVIGGLTHGAPFSGTTWWFTRSFLPFFLIPVVLVAAFGLSFAAERIGALRVASLALIVVLPLISFAQFYPINDKSRYTLAFDYTTGILDSLPSHSVLIVSNSDMNNDIELFSLAYLQVIEKYRTDVTVISDTPVTKRPAGLYLGVDYTHLSKFEQRLRLVDRTAKFYAKTSHPIFTTFPADTLPDSPYASRSNGVAYQLFEKNSIGRPQFQPTTPSQIATNELLKDELTRNLAAKILYHQSLFALETGQTKKAREFFSRAMDIDLPLSEYYGTYLRRRTLLQISRPR